MIFRLARKAADSDLRFMRLFALYFASGGEMAHGYTFWGYRRWLSTTKAAWRQRSAL